MIILGIESSCDETAAAVVRDGYEILAGLISSQVDLHADYGGVVPELAAREHLRNLNPIVGTVLARSGVSAGDLDAIAVTCMPGLIPALLVGLNYAKGLALAGDIPLIGINHFNAHLFSCFLDTPELLQTTANFPLLGLVVSGGHTVLALVEADGRLRIIGQTLDDAAGEAFDKGAKILHLDYPGGPAIERAASGGDPAGYRFPRGLTGGGGKPVRPEDRYNFSFSGLKTSLLYEVKKMEEADLNLRGSDLAASYQAAIVDALVRKTMAAAEDFSAPTVLLCGGVACNRVLRQRLERECGRTGRRFAAASPRHCTDNASMVAGLAWHEAQAGHFSTLDLDAQARLPAIMPRLSFAPEYIE